MRTFVQTTTSCLRRLSWAVTGNNGHVTQRDVTALPSLRPIIIMGTSALSLALTALILTLPSQAAKRMRYAYIYMIPKPSSRAIGPNVIILPKFLNTEPQNSLFSSILYNLYLRECFEYEQYFELSKYPTQRVCGFHGLSTPPSTIRPKHWLFSP